MRKTMQHPALQEEDHLAEVVVQDVVTTKPKTKVFTLSLW